MTRNDSLHSVGDAEIFSLHRYFLWAIHMNALFTASVTEKARLDLRAWTKESIRTFEYMSYWYAGLFVVVEGWKTLELHDSNLDRLLSSPNVGLLKRFRNAVFHYQENFLDQRLMDMVHEGQNAEAWVGELDREFRRYFQAWFDARKESGQSIPEV